MHISATIAANPHGLGTEIGGVADFVHFFADLKVQKKSRCCGHLAPLDVNWFYMFGYARGTSQSFLAKKAANSMQKARSLDFCIDTK